MAALPKSEHQMVEQIYEGVREAETKPFRLSRLGASSIGEECPRAVWLNWRGFDEKEFDGRMLRLFRTGHLQEDRVLADLRRAGYEVWSHQEDGEQFTYTDPTGHVVAKLDGVIKGIPGAEKTPHDLEIKTHSKKSFMEVEKKGVEAAKPMHFYQMQLGMSLSGGLERALYVALCKDDERFYVERIKIDPEAVVRLNTKITSLLNAELTPAGISDDGGAFGCKWCDMRAVCVGEKAPLRHCRTCVNCRPLPTAGQWLCEFDGNVLSAEEQLAGCSNYEPRLEAYKK